MRRQVFWCLMPVLAAALALTLAGCGKGARQAAQVARTAQDAQDGNFTVKGEKGEQINVKQEADKQSGTVTVTGDKGTTVSEYGKDKVTEAEVGVAFYPGAEVQTAAKTTSDAQGAGQFSTVQLTTSAAFAEVAKFYKDKYATGNTVMEQPDSLMIMIKAGENAGKMVMVSTAEGKTQIAISRASSQ